MAITPMVARVASLCPAVRLSAETDILDIDEAAELPAGNAPVSQGIIDAELPWAFRTRLMASRQDMAVRYGGGGAYAIARGLALVSVSNLTGAISKGHALIDGVVNVGEDISITLTDGAQNYVWLLRDGTKQIVLNSLAPPVQAACYLGCLVCDGGQITLLDVSGVVYVRGGVLRRVTADAGMPDDSPPANVQFLAVTQGGRYWWDGEAYAALSESTASLCSAMECAEERIDTLETLMDWLLINLADQFGPDFFRPELLPAYICAQESEGETEYVTHCER